MTAQPRIRRKRMLITAIIATLAAVTFGIMSSGPASASETTVPGQSGWPGDRVVNGNYTDTYSDPVDGDCVVRVNYRGAFGDDPYLDNGWIQNHWRCVAPDGSVSTYQYLMVHESDSRYTGDPDRALWGAWEYKVLTESGSGNFFRPTGHVS